MLLAGGLTALAGSALRSAARPLVWVWPNALVSGETTPVGQLFVVHVAEFLRDETIEAR